MSALKLGTRKSALALWQAETVAALLRARGHACELVPLSTLGDRILDRALAEVGGKGLFVRELEEALRDGRADLAVHSAKDVPYGLSPEFSLCAFPLREDPRDALVAPRFGSLEALPRGACVGTSSLRRATQLRFARPDLRIVSIRGNVATRLSRATGLRADGASIDGETLDAVVLALAGLRRLGLERHASQLLSLEQSLPAAGQGALAIECARGSGAEKICAALDDAAVSRCVLAERAVAESLGGGCTVPIAAHAVLEGESIWLRAALGGPAAARDPSAPRLPLEPGKEPAEPDDESAEPGDEAGVELLRAEARGGAREPEALGARVAGLLRARGAEALLARSPQGAGLPAPKRG